MNIFALAAFGAALVIGALQVFGVTALDDADMLGILFILTGTIGLAGTFLAGHPAWPRGRS